MSKNDAFVFNSDIPHIGFNGSFDDNPNNLRVSIEIRFEYVDFKVPTINFNITYEILTTCAVDRDHSTPITRLNNSDIWKLYYKKPIIEYVGDKDLIPVYFNYIQLLYGLIAYTYNHIWIQNYYKMNATLSEKLSHPSVRTWSILEFKTRFDDDDHDIQTDRYGRFNDPIVCKKFLDNVPYDVLHGDILNMSNSEQKIDQLERIITQFLTV